MTDPWPDVDRLAASKNWCCVILPWPIWSKKWEEAFLGPTRKQKETTSAFQNLKPSFFFFFRRRFETRRMKRPSDFLSNDNSSSRLFLPGWEVVPVAFRCCLKSQVSSTNRLLDVWQGELLACHAAYPATVLRNKLKNGLNWLYQQQMA